MVLLLAAFALEAKEVSSNIAWMDNFDAAAAAAKSQKKPLLLFFTGSDWCPWCKKINNEVFLDKEFAKEVGGDFIFVLIDFPSKGRQSAELINQNQLLKTNYDVQGFPTIILLDPNLGLISRLGYLPIGGKNYADHLRKIIDQFTALQQEFEGTPTAKTLEELYYISKELGCPYWEEKIFQRGLKTDPGPFFLLERYCKLVDEGKIDSEEAREIRMEIESRDPRNLKGSLFRLAILEFQARSAEDGLDPELAVAPLLKYLEHYGRKDKENGWRVEMMIAQFLFTRGLPQKALKHARACFKIAPDAVRKDISDSIAYIRNYLKETRESKKASLPEQ